MAKIPLKPNNETFTDTQWQAIFDEGDHLLVSASAGSGKTTVLVRRVIEKLKSGVGVDELLIVTFTEAAAKEMKERIQVALEKAVNEESDPERRQHFSRQLTLLPMAHISTLHAFCLAVIRRYYYLIGLDPVFRLLTDETERLLLQEEVWEALRDEKYAENETTFFELTRNFSSDRSDEGLTKVVMALFRFAQAHPNPKQWLQNLAENYQVSTSLAAHPLYQAEIKPAFIETLSHSVYLLQVSLDEMRNQSVFTKLAVLFEEEKNQAYHLLEAIKSDQLERAYTLVQQLSFARYAGAPRKEEYKEQAAWLKQQRDAAKENLSAIQSFFTVTPDLMVEQMQKAQPIVTALAELTLEFMVALNQHKKNKGVLEFNDLEHDALAILQGEDQLGSEASIYYRQQFKEVLVDEYQDINRLQEAILSWVRHTETEVGNQFMVGDVKQSIYAFRLADPTLFIEKYLDYENETGGRRIILAENFRSRSEVLHLTNYIFQQLMDEELGQIPYDQSAELVPGFPDFPESTHFAPELLLYEKGEKEEELLETPDLPEFTFDGKTEGELLMVVLKIQQLVQEKFEIYDKKRKENRPVTYRDIVLLAPTRSNNLTLIDIFQKVGIPLEVSDAQNYFQATEVQLMIALLQLIDNPFQDIPLAAILRSPMVGLTEEELALIRLEKMSGSYYEAFLLAKEHNSLLGKKLTGFYTQLMHWREQARRQTIANLLWDIYEKTAYLDYVIGLPSGKQRYANLIALINRAQMYEQSSFRGLYQFIRFIEKIQEKEKDLAQPFSEAKENAVQLMTVHGSKGLEFPVVFLLDLNKQFNTQELDGLFVLDEQLGAGIQVVDDERVKYTTLPYLVIQQKRLNKALSEEMRKLYVALTRAEQKLYLVGSYKDQADAYKKWSPALNETNLMLSQSLRFKRKGNLMDWIGLTLIRHPKTASFFEDAEIPTKTYPHPAVFSLEWWSQKDLLTRLKTIEMDRSPLLFDEEEAPDLTEVFQTLTYEYPMKKSTLTTSYQSVSEMKRLYNDPDDQQIVKLAWETTVEQSQKQPYRYVSERLSQPKFMQKQTIAATEIGTATHTLLQLLPLSSAPTKATLEELVDRFVCKQRLSKEIAKKIPLDKIMWFFTTKLGQELIANHSLVKREQPFSMIKEAKEVYLDFDEEKANLLIHGIIDGYIEYPDRIVLFDFKTDHLYGEQAAKQFAEKYTGQLRLYKEALEEALKKPVTKTYLVALNTQEIYSFFVEEV